MTTYRLTILSAFTHDVWQGDYKSAATGDTLLHEIFRYFNRVDDEDGERLERIGYRQPSMTAGDVLGIARPSDAFQPLTYLCDGSGWREIMPGIGLRREVTA